MSARPGAVHAHPLQGVLLILLAAACFASLDSTVRGLSQPTGRWGVPVLLIITLRYTVQAVVMAVALAPRGRAGFAAAHPKFQWLRGGLLLATSFCSFFAVRFMPVPEYTASACSRRCWSRCSRRRCCASRCRGCAGRSSSAASPARWW